MQTIHSSKPIVLLALTLGVALVGTSAASAQLMTVVSSASDGTPGNSTSSGPSISSDGRFVAFQSLATNLVAGDTNDDADVFVKDRLSGTTTRVSVTTGGVENTEPSGGVHISGNGRFVLFHTLGQLVPEDTSNCATPPAVAPCSDIYVHDRDTGATTLVTLSSTGVQANNTSEAIDISADGRFVLFESAATNLAPTDVNNNHDLFLRDRQLGTTTLVSVDASGAQFPQSDFAPSGRMSADGRFIVYSGPQADTIYIRERETGTLSILSDAFPPNGQSSPSTYVPRGITDDGRAVIVSEQFWVPGFSLPFIRYLFYDRLTGRTQALGGGVASPISFPSLGNTSGDGRIYSTRRFQFPITLNDRVSGLTETIPDSQGFAGPSLSADGRFAALAGGQVYVYDRDSGDGDGMPSSWETTFGLDPANLTDANADADLDGVTNLQEYLRGTHPTALASATRYFAEGAANAFFTTRFAAVNPGDEEEIVVFRFLGSDGLTASMTRKIAARSRITVEMPAFGPQGDDFSTVVESNHPVVVERTMTWDGTGYGAHTETSLAAPSTTWYLAEGATHGAFDLFYLLQNPNDSQAHVTINYLRQAPLAPISRTYQVEANSRKTVPVDAEGPELEAVDTAAAITSDLPIVAERAMYSTRAGQPPFAAGHGAAGVTAPALRWFLAEGATGPFFDLFVLVGNPNATESELKVTYLRPGGAPPFEKLYSVGGQQRLTINVQQEDARLENTPVSVIVESTNNQPVVVERAMWWPKDQWYESHVSAGATTTGTRWALADGEVTAGGDTYILIANTSATAGTATVTILEEFGTPTQITVDLEASSRVNVPVSQYLPLGPGQTRRRFGALIESSGVDIVVERSIYTTVGGVTWSAGTAALGTKLQ